MLYCQHALVQYLTPVLGIFVQPFIKATADYHG